MVFVMSGNGHFRCRHLLTEAAASSPWSSVAATAERAWTTRS
ncbi:hypothetical protein [Streptomyces litmocidini]